MKVKPQRHKGTGKKACDPPGRPYSVSLCLYGLILLPLMVAPLCAQSPPSEPHQVGSVLFYGGYPDLANGNDMSGWFQAQDFNLSAASVIHTVRFWTIENPGVWDGTCQYEILSNSGGGPGSILNGGNVKLARFSTGRVAFSRNEWANEFDLPAGFSLNAGTYWLALHMNASCSAVGIFLETGTPGYGANGREQGGCSGGWSSISPAQEHAFAILGSVTAASQDLGSYNLVPTLSNLIGADDRGAAFDMNATIPVSSVGILATIGSATTLTATIRSVSGTTIGGVLATASTAVSTGGPKYFDVPLNYTFQNGQRYDLAFNVTGGWGSPSAHKLELYAFDNATLNPASGYIEGAFTVLDGRGTNGGTPYQNTLMPHLRVTFPQGAFQAYGLIVAGDFVSNYLAGFNLDTPQVFTLLGPTTSGSHWVGLDVRPGFGINTLYAVDATLGKLVTINSQTGAIASLGSVKTKTGSGEAFTGLSFDPTSGILYASGATPTTTRSSLYSVSLPPASISATYLGTTTASPGIIDIAANQSGTLYGIDVVNNNLVTINKSNGAATAVGPLGFDIDYTEGLEFDPATGTLYGSLIKVANGYAELYTINSSTGAAALVGKMGSIYPGGNQNISDVAVANDATPSPTPTVSSTPTPSPTRSATPTPTRSATPSPTRSSTPTPTSSATPTPTPFNDAQIVYHTIPSQMTTGQNFTVGLRVLNTGNTTWSAGVPDRLAVTTDSCSMFTPNRMNIVGSDTVAPGQVYIFSGVIQAPGAPGPCSLQFQMVEGFSTFFGQTLSVPVSIVTPTPTSNAARNWNLYE